MANALRAKCPHCEDEVFFNANLTEMKIGYFVVGAVVGYLMSLRGNRASY